MKIKIITLAMVAIATVCSVHAQDAVKPTQDPAIQQQRQEQQAERRNAANEKMAVELGLDQEQTARVQEVDAEYIASMEALRASGDRERLIEEGNQVRAKRDERLKEILTPEQYERMTTREATPAPRGTNEDDLLIDPAPCERILRGAFFLFAQPFRYAGMINITSVDQTLRSAIRQTCKPQ